MDLFEEWAKQSTQHASILKYADRLVEMGVSWDSFLSRSQEEVARDFVRGGIPILAARDIVDVATAAAKQSQAPLAIFWDLENMPIPTTSSGRDVSSRLKCILKPYGHLVQFRGYASIGLNLIPQQKRSDLQLSGCLLVDCPYNNRKEVADKMIIVDAMNFAMRNPDGATLCFVTGDVDYAYLLAILQCYKQYRTIVISKGTLQSILDVNCDMKMRWETDILQLRSSPAWRNTAVDLGLSIGSDMSASGNRSVENIEETFEPLTANEEWIDDVEFLRNIVRREGGSVGIVRKSLVGSLLRQTNPARFPNRDAVKQFLAETIERDVILETGEGAFKVVSLPTDETTGTLPAISLAQQIPVPLESVPEKVIVAAETERHYVVFVKWKFNPTCTTNLSVKRAYVLFDHVWAFLLFHTLTDAQRTVSEFPWLRNGTLVDWRRANTEAIQFRSNLDSKELNSNSICAVSGLASNDRELKQLKRGRSELACPEGVSWEEASCREKNAEVDKIVDYLEFMARQDHIYVADNLLKKKWQENLNRKQAAIRVEYAIEVGRVVTLKHPSVRSKLLCLSDRFDEASQPFPPYNLDTKAEEDHVWNMLRDGKRWALKTDVIESLRRHFPSSMSHPYYRNKVFMNDKRRFCVAKTRYGHVVALTRKDAKAGCSSLAPNMNSAETDDSTNDDDSGGDSTNAEGNLRKLLRLSGK